MFPVDVIWSHFLVIRILVGAIDMFPPEEVAKQIVDCIRADGNTKHLPVIGKEQQEQG